MFNRKKRKIEELKTEIEVLNQELLDGDDYRDMLGRTNAELNVSIKNLVTRLEKAERQAKKTHAEVADEILELQLNLEPIPDNAVIYGLMLRIPGWNIRDEETLIRELQWLVAYHVHKGKQGDPHVQPEKKAFTSRRSCSKENSNGTND